MTTRRIGRFRWRVEENEAPRLGVFCHRPQHRTGWFHLWVCVLPTRSLHIWWPPRGVEPPAFPGGAGGEDGAG